MVPYRPGGGALFSGALAPPCFVGCLCGLGGEDTAKSYRQSRREWFVDVWVGQHGDQAPELGCPAFLEPQIIPHLKKLGPVLNLFGGELAAQVALEDPQGIGSSKHDELSVGVPTICPEHGDRVLDRKLIAHNALEQRCPILQC